MRYLSIVLEKLESGKQVNLKNYGEKHMTIPEAKRTARIIEWRQLIYERQQSGQSVKAWYLQNGIRENRYYYWLRIIREEALCETKNRSGALVRVEPEKLAVETVSSQTASGGILIRTHGVEAEFPSGTDIGILAAFVKAVGHARFQPHTELLHCLRIYGHAQADRWLGSTGANPVRPGNG